MKNKPKKEVYDIGYGKPPKHTQFTKGRVGQRSRTT